jgi:hypothetical protein
MMSLRSFHLVFILTVIVGADLFGAWSVWNYAQRGDVGLLTLGILAVLGGFGLIWYAIRLVRGMDSVHIA